MFLNHHTDCIRCYFDPVPAVKPLKITGTVDVFFAETQDLVEAYSNLKQNIGKEEQDRADKFVHEKDRTTYISCHAILRLLLSGKLNISPLEITYLNGVYNKPMLPGDPVFFNITHTGQSFAIVISDSFEAGIDMESINREMNFRGIIKSFFSKSESEFILEEPDKASDRFFKLWTRKEAFLKALGTGIADNLKGVEVSGKENHIRKESFENLVPVSVLREHYIYSIEYLHYFLSIAVPCETEINFHHLSGSNIFSFFQ